MKSPKNVPALAYFSALPTQQKNNCSVYFNPNLFREQ